MPATLTAPSSADLADTFRNSVTPVSFNCVKCGRKKAFFGNSLQCGRCDQQQRDTVARVTVTPDMTDTEIENQRSANQPSTAAREAQGPAKTETQTVVAASTPANAPQQPPMIDVPATEVQAQADGDRDRKQKRR